MRGGLTPSSALHLSGGRRPPQPPWGGRSAPPPPGDFAGAGAPCTHYAGAPPCTRVTFPPRGKSPKARQGLRPWTCRCGVTALFALAALRFGSRRATFYLRPRPICHFEIAGANRAYASPQAVAEVTPPAVQTVARQRAELVRLRVWPQHSRGTGLEMEGVLLGRRCSKRATRAAHSCSLKRRCGAGLLIYLLYKSLL